MRLPRRSGILLHLTSLPGDYGVGDLGESAFDFVEFLHRAGLRIWQVLPLGPTARGNSPYTCLSAFGGNANLISLTRLVRDGFLAKADLPDAPAFPQDEVDYEAVWQFKRLILETSFRHFRTHATAGQRDAFRTFREANRHWLDDYALFIALSGALREINWSEWDRDLVLRRPAALQHWEDKLHLELLFEKYVQFIFFRQWNGLKAFAKQRGVDMFGDLPIFVAYESADVWVHQDYFQLDQHGKPTVVAGVPPDYFSETGQLWENPLYRWDRIAATGYDWWLHRLRHAFSLFDIVRIDHFRGFESYWEVPATAETAVQGRWVKGPGSDPFRAAERELGELRIVAEDLGLITPAVHELRDELQFPGMRVLQFGFETAGGEYHRPESFPQHCVVYTGTHDNDTVVGWYQRLIANRDRAAEDLDCILRQNLGSDRGEIHWDLIQLAFSSVADTAIIPLQDVLGLGSEARMNVPGQAEGNWKWRFRKDVLSSETERRLRDLADRYHRLEC